MATQLDINNKQLFALLNGIIKRTFYNDASMTSQFLKDNIFPELDVELKTVDEVIAHYTTILKHASLKALSPANFTAYLQSSHNITDEEVLAVFAKIWKAEHTKIHTKLIDDSKHVTTYDRVEWRVDTLTGADGQTLPSIALVNIHTKSVDEKPSTIQFELNAGALKSLLSTVNAIDQRLEQFS